MMIGTKFDIVNSGDMGRAVGKKEIEEFCAVHGIRYYETSSKTGYNVKESFMDLVHLIYDMGPNNPGNAFNEGDAVTLSTHLNKSKREDDGGCC